MNVLGITSIRSDYDLTSELFKAILSHEGMDIKLLVSGAHLSPVYGFTIDQIKSDGLEILLEVESLISADTQSARLKSASVLLMSSIDAIKAYQPDLIIYSGDREDVLIGAMLGSFLGIPTLHLFGGDHAEDGHIDNPVRHATSKLSTVHFVSTDEHRQRLISIGESQDRIFVTGSIALDKFFNEPWIELSQLLPEVTGKIKNKDKPFAILIFHPIGPEKDLVHEYMSNAVSALKNNGYHIFLSLPNSDPGNYLIQDFIGTVKEDPDISVYKSLPRSVFVNLMRHSDLMVGNSSAGILEAPSLKLPAVNIGDRQRGRLCAGNVVFCGGEFSEIDSAVKEVNSTEFKESLKSLVNVYGDGCSVEKSLKLISSIDFSSMLAKKEDPLLLGSK
ncbi:UDP-N-acetylglucosamine 2-epimerase [Halomonas alimentaria]|uniref:UDP-N-acetylglucosamine 2-epimerase n=1 Tax=Halomonas alimentaria TaxID=147248 RepID=UPI002492F30C|nr:UDP-N-acetylglucosamine 2-epimerase [Halomonas alimentaria]